MRKVLDFIRVDSSRNVEFFSAVQSFLTSFLSFYFFMTLHSVTPLDLFFVLNTIASIVQIYALTMENRIGLKVRHWSNVFITFTIMIIVILISKSFSTSMTPWFTALSFGIYTGLLIMCLYTVYATDRDIRTYDNLKKRYD